MFSQSTMRRTRALIGTGFAAALSLAGSPSHAQRATTGSGPFGELSGTWSGNGTITLSSGTRERIRCRSAYVVGNGGNNLQLRLRCASDSYTFDLNSNVNHTSGAISGSWSETTRNVAGSLSGRASANEIQARVDSPSFSANLTLTTRGDRQTVAIESRGSELAAVSIALRRGAD
jgi:hypothetical protein